MKLKVKKSISTEVFTMTNKLFFLHNFFLKISDSLHCRHLVLFIFFARDHVRAIIFKFYTQAAGVFRIQYQSM